MRILITGMSSWPCGTGNKHSIQSSSLCLGRILQDMGHEVDQRPVKEPFCVTEFDYIFLFPYDPHWLASCNMIGTYWTLGKALHHGVPFAIALDDWQTNAIANGLRAIQRNDWPIWNPKRGKWDFKGSNDDLDLVEMTIREVDITSCPALVPAYNDGNLDLLGWDGELFSWDPTCGLRGIYEPVQCKKELRWVNAALAFRELEGAKWPILRYGDEKSNKVSERDLFNVYCHSAGVMSSVREIQGARWWRVRYHMAMQAGCVLAGEVPWQDEPLLVSDVEDAVETHGLARVLAEQMALYNDVVWPEAACHSFLEALISE